MSSVGNNGGWLLCERDGGLKRVWIGGNGCCFVLHKSGIGVEGLNRSFGVTVDNACAVSYR